MHVLIVDDSAVVRQTVSGMLAGEPDVSVTVAADPLIAMRKIARHRPDVILLDIEMPRMDGLTFLGRLMAEDPIPVVVCSAVAGPQSEPAFRALQQGAIDIVPKPRIGVREFLEESRVLLVDALRAASVARIHVDRRASSRGESAAGDGRRSTKRRCHDDRRIVALGASTGGTEALRVILSELPAQTPGMVIVQHMPEVFTAHFARHLNAGSALQVKEAEDGDRLVAGRALVAPGNRHMKVRRDHGGYYVAVDCGPLVSRHRPSVDVLFRSVAEAAGPDAMGVILTGMGADGADGIATMKRAGAATIAQDEKSCVVFGMPKEAIARRSVDEIVPLGRIASAIVRFADATSPAP